MIFRAFDELISTMPSVFWCQLSPSDAAKLLDQQSNQVAPSGEHIVGRSDDSKVVLWMRRALIANPFAPIFAGEFRTTANGTQLVGEFRRRKIVLLLCGLSYFVLLPGIPFALAAMPLMALWLGVSLLWGIVAGILFALVLAGMLFAEAAVIRLGVYAARQDANLVAKHIDNVFRRGAA